MEFGFYSFSEPFKQGIDFYTVDEATTIQASLSGDATLSVNFTMQIRSSTSVESNASITATKIAHAQSSIVIDGVTLTLGTGIKSAAVLIENSSSMTVSAQKIAFAAVSITSASNLSASAQEILNATVSIASSSDANATIIKQAFASVLINSTSNVSAQSILIKNISASLNGNINLTVAGDLVLITIRIVINNLGSVAAQAIKFSNTSISSGSPLDIGGIRTFLLLDDKPLTNHNRKFDVSVEPIFTENVNWNNRKSRYYKSTSRGARKTFNLSWSYVPNTQTHTVDGKRGRDYIREIAGKPQYHVLKVINLDENGNTPPTETSYNVLVKDYSETLVRRDISEEVYFWDCSISLEEV
jgi:hypothetical protein